MKNIVKSEQSIGQQEYNLVEKVQDNINIYKGVLSFNLCDIIFYDKDNDKLVKDTVDDNLITRKPADKFTPIGIVVIPSSHNVYGDNSCGVMSLKEMNASKPDTGGIFYYNLRFGHYKTDIPELTNYNVVCYIGNNGNPQNTIQGTTSNAYLPSDKFSNVQCPHDTDTYYYYNNSNYYIPSPYLTNGERNPLYYQTSSPSSSNNAMSDFNGRDNSQVLWDRATAQSDWRTASTIIVNLKSGYSPAACCCWRYHTDGTQQGDWYLPACGELGYIVPSFNKINEAITSLLNAYSASVGVTWSTDYYYLSSSQYSRDDVLQVGMGNGNVSSCDKSSDRLCRAWLRILPNMEVVRN